MSLLLDQLRQETRPLHEETEVIFYGESLRNGTLSPVEYGHLLGTHLAYHQSLEAAIDAFPLFFEQYQPETRRKTPWLLADLEHFSAPLPPTPPDLFAGWSAAQLLGAAYVGEGSMLGGAVINRLLRQNQALLPVLGQARFYAGYGSGVGRMWSKFGGFLIQKGLPVAHDVVGGASLAFGVYQQAFEDTARLMKALA